MCDLTEYVACATVYLLGVATERAEVVEIPRRDWENYKAIIRGVMESGMSKVMSVVVVIDDESHGDKKAVARIKKAVTEAGMTEVCHLETVGLLTGKAPADALPGLNKIKGVKKAEEDIQMEIPEKGMIPSLPGGMADINTP